MFKIFFIIFLLVHVLGDFYFQSEKLINKKENAFFKVLIHCLVYGSVLFILIIPIINKRIAFASLFVSVAHFIIESIKYFIVKKYCKEKKLSESITYLTDQALHIIMIMLASVYVSFNCNAFTLPEWVDSVFEIIGIGKLQFISWLLMTLLIWKPVNSIIKKALSSYKPAESTVHTDAQDKNSGGLIGFLERMIILIFLSIGQYSAIGLVLTAKSIARYNKIAEDKKFAEYYLLGTLLSTLSVIIIYFIIA
jgi:hypothetical protein